MIRLLIRLATAMVAATLLGQLASYLTHDRSLREDVHRMLQGPGRLIADKLAHTPPPERAALAERLSQSFGYPVRLETETRGGDPHAEWRSGELALVAPLPDGHGQAVLGPVPIGEGQTGFVPVLALVLLLATAFVVVAAWPLVQRVRALEALASRMCEGHFEVRSKVEPGEPLSGLGSSLNQLGERIGQLLSDERDLMRTVAHEVRAPISRMRFRVDMLQTAAPEPAARHAAGLVSDLREVDSLFEELLTYVAFDEFDHERPEFTTTTFTLGEAVRPVVAEIAETVPQVHVSVEGSFDATVVANRKLFDRAVANLVRNAVAYCDSRVVVILRSFPSARVVDVQDDGPGIPEADRPRVIKPFVRLDTGGRKPRGTGLGLAIVTRIMRLHHGCLHLVDAPRGGASCQLMWTLPSAQKTTWRDAWARKLAGNKR